MSVKVFNDILQGKKEKSLEYDGVSTKDLIQVLKKFDADVMTVKGDFYSKKAMLSITHIVL